MSIDHRIGCNLERIDATRRFHDAGSPANNRVGIDQLTNDPRNYTIADPDMFGIAVRDRRMEGAGILNGDICVISPNSERRFRVGDIVCVYDDGQMAPGTYRYHVAYLRAIWPDGISLDMLDIHGGQCREWIITRYPETIIVGALLCVTRRLVV